MSDVFISYSRKDIAFARLLQESLQQSQIDTWIDWDRIPIGERWWEEICEAIENANIFMFVISQNSIGSNVCKDEIHHALKNHKRIIPIVVDQLSPESVSQFAPELPAINWIIFEKDHIFRIEENPDVQSEKPEDQLIALPKAPQFEEALEKLSKTIHTDWEWVKYHTRLQVNALLWENNANETGYLIRGAALEAAEQQLLRASGKEPRPTELQAEFVTASRKEEVFREQEKLRLEQKARRRQRVIILAVGIGLIVASVLGFVAWNQRNQYLDETIVRATAQSEAEEQRNIAEEQRNLAEEQKGIAEEQRNIAIEQRNLVVTRQLSSQSLIEADKNFDLALLLSLEANRRTQGAFWTQANLLEIIQHSPRLLSFVRGHSNDVTSVAISPDSQLLATASGDSTYVTVGANSAIRLWDISDPQKPKLLGSPLMEHSGSVMSVAFSPDGSILASGGGDPYLILWDVSNPERPTIIGQPLKGHSDTVMGVDFSPDGKLLASGSDDGTIILWDVSNPETPVPIGEPLKWALGAVHSVTFSPDGRLLAPITFNKFINHVILWDISDPEKPLLIINASPSQTDAVAFSPSSQILASRSFMGVITLWDFSNPASLKKISEIPSTDSALNTSSAIVFSPDGSVLATGGGEKNLTLWDVSLPQNPTIIDQPLIGHVSNVKDLVFSPDGKLLVSGSWDNTAIVWDMDNLHLPRFFGEQLTTDALVAGVAFSPDGQSLISGDGEAISVWDLNNQAGPIKFHAEGSAHQKPVWSIALSPDGSLAATGSADETIILWDVNDPQHPVAIGQPLLGNSDLVGDLAFSPNGTLLASANYNFEVILWDISDPLRYKPVGLGFTGLSIAFRPDGKVLAIHGAENDLLLWNIENPAAPELLAKYSSNERLLIYRMVFSLDGKTLFTASSEGKVNLWDVGNENAITPLGKPIFAHAGLVYGLSLSPDGQILAIGSSDTKISLWNISDPLAPFQLGQTYVGHKGAIRSLAFSPDGRTLASGSEDQSIILWNTNLDGLASYACQVAGRNLTHEEWKQFIPLEEPYQVTCPGLD